MEIAFKSGGNNGYYWKKLKMKIYLFIDGTNLYAAQYELFGPKKYLDFSKFIKEVEEKIKVKFNKIHFYASYSPNPKKPTKKEKLYLKNEALFYKSVKKTKNVVFFRGYRSKTSRKEKEVDVKLAVDIVDFAHRDKFSSMYLFSGDADFLQALFAIKSLGKKIFVISLQNKVLYRAAFFFLTYVVVFRKPVKIKFLRFQRKAFIQIEEKEIIGEVQ